MDLNEVNIAIRENEYIAIIHDKAYKINFIFYSIFFAMQKGLCLEEAIGQLSESQLRISEDEIRNSFLAFLAKVENMNIKRNTYIKYRIIFFHKKTTERISHLFLFLFNRKVFCVLFFVTVLVNLLFLLNLSSLNNKPEFTLVELWVLFILGNIFIVFHEIGHATASYKFNLPAKDIGFGFYLIFPVFFTDVTRIWLLPKKRRIVINLGGIYFQLLANFILILLFYIFQDSLTRQILWYFIYSNLIIVAYSFIPFFRNDGYWIYSDLFKLSNLLAESDNLLFKFLYSRNELVNIRFPLIIYTASNWVFRFFILFSFSRFIYKKIEYLSEQTVSFQLITDFLCVTFSAVGLCVMSRSIYQIIKREITQYS